MAKPLPPIPTLRGEDAESFIEKMIETQNRNPTEQEKKLARDARNLAKHLGIKI